MKETEKRIKQYKELLPHAREKVFAALLIFIISAVVMVSTTFAWLVLSRSPEVSGIATNIAANGNLEIALSGPEGEQPPDSMVGDSVKDILLRNLTWGNIINLADPSYGLGNIELRPASLNLENLLDKPLFGATYSKDGRVEKLNKDFAYSNYDSDNDLFVVSPANSPKYGVRAISSVMTTNIGGDRIYQAMLQLADDKNIEAGQNYLDIVGKKDYLDALVGVIGRYAQTKVGDSNPDCTEYVSTIYQMCLEFEKVFEESGEALLLLAQAQQFKATNDQYGTLTLDELCTLSAADLKKRGVNLSSLATYKSDRYTLNSCLDTFKTLAEKSSSQTVYWNDIRVAMNQLVDINSTTLQVVGSSDAPIPVGSLSMGNATKFSDETSYAVIQKGLIRNFEKRTGALMSILDVSKRTASASVKATVGFITQTVTITAIVSTNAAVPYDFGKDYTEALNNDSGFAGGDRVAQDTYGLAVDFWLRTNAASTYIKLEGATLTSKKEEQVKDFQGNEIWTATATIDGEEVTHDLIKDEDGNRWLLADGGDDVTDTIIDYGITPVKKMEVTETVIGYEGENRVWQDLNLSPNATTQGSGSCYVFYADTPQDQAQSLKLLGSMKVAFIDQNGVKLATAKMDTDHFYADSGRVTVPMVLDETDSVLSGSDIEGKPIRAITQINKRSPIRITALVYLSGSSLTNDMVLSSSNIEGQLNIQFGSTEQLFPIEDETLEDDTISVTATVDRTSFDYEKDAANMVANVDVTVEGFEPETVEAFFVRKINATQGTRQETMVFTKNDLSRAATGNGSTWHASQTFTMPGIYVLRNVRIDGVDYPVKDAVTVTIDGFDVQSLTCRDTYLFTSEKRASTALTLRFSASDDKLLPKKSVQGVFINENNVSTTVSFKKNPASHDYLGTADFVTSGMYRLQYLILDGETYELPEAMWKNVEVYIGLSAIVDLDRTNPENAITEFEFNKELGGGKTVALMVKIVDDSGNEITGMTGTRLYYKMSGSIKTLAEDLVWDSDMQAYKGNFIVRGAGIYSFKNLTVGSNNITYASRSFIIKATSPEPPAYHSAEKTKDYQFAPKENAEFILDITNSVAIDAKAVIVSVNDPTKSETVKGSIVEASTVDLGNGTVSSWSFLIPGEGKEDSITQDGEWQVKAIHLSGFTFENENGNQVSYTEDSPLVIDLSSNNIVTKVVCTYNIKVTGEDQEFIGDFMTKQNVANERATIVIEDYEHEPIPGVGNVQLVYDISDHNYSLNSDNYKKYGYTYTGNGYNEGLAKKTVTCTATGDGKTFVADTFELQYSGEYQAELYFDIGSSKYTTNQDEPANYYKFTVNGIPKYTVLWNAPTVKVTGTNPAPSTSFSKNIDGRGGTNLTAVSVKNYYEDYYACVYEKVSSALGMATGYTLSEITLKLEGAGSALSSSNNAKITLKNSSTNERSYDNVFTFTNSQSQTGKVGGMDRNSRVLLGKATVTTIDMTYEGNVFTLNLSHDLEIKGPNLLNPTLSFDIPAEHAWLVSDLNLTNNPNPSGRDISFTAPATITKKGMDTKQVGEAQLVGYKVETKTQPIKWTEGSGCSSSDKKGSKVTTVRTPVYQGTFAEVERTFTIAKWSVTTTTRSHTTNTSSATINAGATRNFTGGDNVITPVVTYVDGAMGEEYESTEYGDEEDPVVTWPNGEPGSNWSNDGNATTATTYTDASGKTISKPAGWPAG